MSEDTPVLTLDEIRAQHRENEPEALRLIDAFLRRYPDDIEGQLLKAEICLARRAHAGYDFVRQVLAQTYSTDDLTIWADKLREQREDLIQQEMQRGRGALEKNKLDDAMEDFARALRLSEPDASLYFVAGQAMAQHIPAPSSDRPPWLFGGPFRGVRVQDGTLQDWHATLTRYLHQALDLTTPQTPLFADVLAVLAGYYRDWNRPSAAFIALAQQLPGPPPDVVVALRDQAIDNAQTMALVLLRLNKPRQASRLLNLARKNARKSDALHYLTAEKERQNGRPDKARRALERIGDEAPTPLDMDAWHKLQVQLDKQQIDCANCHKSQSLFVFDYKKAREVRTGCPLCHTTWGEAALWVDAYELSLKDTSALAALGLAHLALEAGEHDAAQAHLEDAEAALENHQKAQLKVRVLRQSATQPDASSSRLDRLDAQIERDNMGDSLLYYIGQINRQTPEQWAELPAPRRLKLCRLLLNHGQYAVLQRLLPIAFADNPARKSVKQFVAQMDKTIQAHVQAQRDPAEQALLAGRPEDAARLMINVIDLRPNQPDLYLIRGEAHLMLQQDAPALDDFHRVLDLTDDYALRDRAIKKIAVLLEQRWDLDGAQKMLGRVSVDDDETEQLYQRIERRRQALPYIHVKPAAVTLAQDSVVATSGPPSHHALFAIAVREVSAIHHAEAVNQVLAASFEFIQSLGNFRDVMHDVVFALRFIGWPYPEIPERGSIRVALVVRVTDSTAEIAARRAKRVYHDLLPSLPLSQENIYVFEPVVDQHELTTLLEPFQSDDISQIVRRESSPEQDGVYTVAPFRVGTRDLHGLMWTLLRQAAPVMVSLHLKPTHFYPWERQTQINLPPASPPLSEEGVELGFLLDHAQATQQVIDGHTRQTEQFKTLENPFLLQINVAGAEGNTHFLPNLVGASLLASANNQYAAGGHVVVRASNQAEHDIAGRNLSDIDVEHWGYTNAPDERKHKMRYLVSEQEAATLFRLPIPDRRGVPGLALLEGRPIAPPAGMSSRGTPLGVSTARAANAMPIKVRISDADRRRHLYVVGKTGTGKSTLLANIVLHDIYAGKAVCLLDPHGDLVQDVLLRIPDYRKEDVILFDPSDQDYPIGLNILNPKDLHQH